MKTLLYRYICSKCEEKFNAPGVSDFSYGQFIMFSESGFYSAYLDALSDPVYSEMDHIIKTIPPIIEMGEDFQADFFQNVFSITCDLAPDEGLYCIGKQPACPVCHSQKMKSWEPTDPQEYADTPSVTHIEWERLTNADKRKKIETFFINYQGSKP